MTGRVSANPLDFSALQPNCDWWKPRAWSEAQGVVGNQSEMVPHLNQTDFIPRVSRALFAHDELSGYAAMTAVVLMGVCGSGKWVHSRLYVVCYQYVCVALSLQNCRGTSIGY